MSLLKLAMPQNTENIQIEFFAETCSLEPDFKLTSFESSGLGLSSSTVKPTWKSCDKSLVLPCCATYGFILQHFKPKFCKFASFGNCICSEILKTGMCKCSHFAKICNFLSQKCEFVNFVSNP